MRASLIALAFAAALAGPPSAQALPRRIAALAVAVDRRSEADAAALQVRLARAVRADARFEGVDLTSLALGDARAQKARKGSALLSEALNLIDEMNGKAAVQRASSAIAAFEEADLTSAFPDLLDSVAARAFAHYTAGEKAQVKSELVRLFTLRPDYQLDPRRASPVFAPLAADARATASNGARLLLEVRSEPVPGEVFVDGAFRGIAPVSVGGLSPGAHYVTVRAPGYDLGQERRSLTRSAQLQIALQPAPGERGLLELVQSVRSAPGSATPAAAVARWAGADEVMIGAVQRREEGGWATITRTAADGRVIATVEGPLRKPEAGEDLAREALLASAAEPAPAAAPTPPPPPPPRASARAPRGAAAAAVAPSGVGAGWLLGGAGLGAGQTALLGEVGWPGAQASLLHGLSEGLDVGGLVGLDFGLNGILDTGISSPGLRLGGIVRLSLIDEPHVNLGLRLSPQAALYFASDTVFGFIVPVELAVGLKLMPELALHFGFSVPLYLLVSPSTLVAVSFLPGLGLEYKFDPAISLTLDCRVGPAFDLTDRVNYLQIRALMGIGYRF